MEKAEMIEAMVCRKNVTDFLDDDEIAQIEANGVHAHGRSFDEIAQDTLSLLDCDAISNTSAAAVFKILMYANKSFRTERFRFNSNSHELYEFDELCEGYVLINPDASYEEYMRLVNTCGQFID